MEYRKYVNWKVDSINEKVLFRNKYYNKLDTRNAYEYYM